MIPGRVRSALRPWLQAVGADFATVAGACLSLPVSTRLSQIDNDPIHPGRVAAASRDGRSPASRQTLAEVDRAHLLQVLRDTHGMIGGPHGATARLDSRRTTLLYRREKLGISHERA
jgi:transcriptional regulator with GAF, ATPase, and Fis domain